MEKSKKIDRLLSMGLDHVSMCFVVILVTLPGVIPDFIKELNSTAPPKLFLGSYFLNIFAFSLYFNKDILAARSLGKRTFNFIIVSRKTNKPAGPIRCVIRNLTAILWLIEVPISIINPKRRIGDLIAGTKLEVYDQEKYALDSKINLLQVVIAITIAMVYTYFVMIFPLEYAIGDEF